MLIIAGMAFGVIRQRVGFDWSSCWVHAYRSCDFCVNIIDWGKITVNEKSNLLICLPSPIPTRLSAGIASRSWVGAESWTLGGSVKKQGGGLKWQDQCPHESIPKTQRQTGSSREALGPSPRHLQHQDKPTGHKPGTCHTHAGTCQMHASCAQHASGPWLAWATSTHTTALLGRIIRILAATSSSKWPRASS